METPLLVTSGSDVPASTLMGGGVFEEETLAVLSRLRKAIAEAMTILPGGVQKSQDIQKRLKLNFKISWQIYRLMRADHVLEISPYIPSARPMRHLLEAMETHGVAPTAIRELEEAYAGFEAHVLKFCGDRASFEAMTTRTIGGAADTQIELSHRRAVFDSYRYLLGFEQDLFVGTLMIHPSARGTGHVDSIYFRLRQNLRRLRSDIPLRVDATWVQEVEASPTALMAKKTIPLDEAAYRKYGIYVLPEFCSPNIQLVQSRKPNDLLVTKWVAEDVGRLSSVDLAVGQFDQEERLIPRSGGMLGTNVLTSVTTPTRKFIHDIVVHRSALGPVDFDVSFWYTSELPHRDMRLEDLDIPQLPTTERMSFMRGIDGGSIAEVPYYTEMLKRYCAQVGWKPEDMLLYRMRMEYPVPNVVQRIECLFPSLTA